jgi:hypothetical protein
MCTSYIVRHINEIPPTEIFTTRHMLIYGTRKGVDSALGRLVSTGYIHRLARGVFVRDLSDEPTLVQIVEAKLKAFGGKIAIHAKKILCSFHLETGDYAYTFAKNGSSSSFDTIHGRAVLKNQCARKMRLYQQEIGKAAIALWHLRDKWFDGAVDVVTASFNRSDKEMLLLSSVLKPAWLTAECSHRYSKRLVCARNPFFATD